LPIDPWFSNWNVQGEKEKCWQYLSAFLNHTVRLICGYFIQVTVLVFNIKEKKKVLVSPYNVKKFKIRQHSCRCVLERGTIASESTYLPLKSEPLKILGIKHLKTPGIPQRKLFKALVCCRTCLKERDMNFAFCSWALSSKHNSFEPIT